MKLGVIIVGFVIVGVILLAGAWVGVPAVLGSSTDLTTFSADDISAYRWKAMADYYSKQNVVDLTTLSADEISAYRWKAMADFYSQKPTVDLRTLSPDEISAYRWNAMAEFYSANGLLSRP